MPNEAPWQRAARGANLLGADGEVAATIFAEMSALAASTGAINLGQGFPDESGPAEVLDEAVAAIRRGENQYPPGRGTPDLRLAITEHQSRFYGETLDPETEILVTAGATEALAATILALVEPGDEVVTLEPFYDAYGALIRLAGGIHRTIQLRSPDFQPRPEDIREAISDRTRMVLINSPHNPTGSVLPRETLQLIADCAEQHDALIVTDEVYEHLTFSVTHVPISTLPGASDRTITISSGGKTFSTTGWKVGWLSAPARLVTAILAVKQFLTYVNGAPFQPAIAAGLRLPDAYFAAAASSLADKRDLLSGGLEAAGFRVFSPQGTYFVLADAAPLGYPNAAELCRNLPSLAGVVGVPLSAFCTPANSTESASIVRFAFCKRPEVLKEAASRLARLGQ